MTLPPLRTHPTVREIRHRQRMRLSASTADPPQPQDRPEPPILTLSR